MARRMFQLPMIQAGGNAIGATVAPGQGGSIPNRAQLDVYNVFREGWEAIGNSLYDSAAYAAAGQNTLVFFQTPVGQSSKTLSDTNMVAAGQLPANQEFLLECIEVLFLPSTPTAAAQMPAVFGAQVAAEIVNDVYKVLRSGNLNLTIGSKPYLQEAPLMKFPPAQNLEVSAALADQTTAGAAMQSRIAYAKNVGRPYYLRAPIRIGSNTNFTVTLGWPEGLVTITNPGKIFLSLGGVLYRRSQ